MSMLKALIRKFIKDESGASAVEYALITALISVGAIVFMTQIGTGVEAAFQEVCNALDTAVSTANLNCAGS